MSKTNIALGTKAWADRINAAWQSSVDGILTTCQLLVEAKKALKGEFASMIRDELRFSESTAKMLVLIGQDTRLSYHGNSLPPHWRTLYELTRLTDEQFERAIQANLISPDMERADVPRERRNRSTQRSEPRTIDGTATEVPPASALSASDQPNQDAERVIAENHDRLTRELIEDKQRTIARLEAENAKLRERPPEVRAQSPGVLTVTMMRDQPDANFWTALKLILGQWTKLGSLSGLVPDGDTIKILEQYDIGKFTIELDGLNDELKERRDADERVGDAA